MCMTRMNTFTEDETIAITPLRTFPVIRDLVTDVSYNYEKARMVPAFAPPADLEPGELGGSAPADDDLATTALQRRKS